MTQINEEYINHSPYKLGQFGDQLESMTAQEVFNIAVEHLLLQDKQSYSEELANCVYNGDGVCCAAAPFIKDYKPEMEGKGWKSIRHTNNHKLLLCSLQMAHDRDDWEYLPNELKAVAEWHGLVMPQILIDKLNAN